MFHYQGTQSASFEIFADQGGTSCSSSMEEDSINNPTIQCDVFISFKEDDSNRFVDDLYNYLTRKGLFVCKSDTQFQNEQSVSPLIEHSWISIIVFSKNYANSTYCLDEMIAIQSAIAVSKLSMPSLYEIIYPVFYGIDPLDVRTQKGVYQRAFLSHSQRQRYDPGRVAGWKSAMTLLTYSTGWKVNPGESTFGGVIENIAKDVINGLCHKFSWSSEDLIGVQPGVKALESLLKLGSEDDGFKVLGICGVAGIGKTTLAKVLYGKISYQFHACCFIENVNKIYEDGGAIEVEKELASQIIQEDNLDKYSPLEISEIVTDHLRIRKALVVLDDVDQFEQLQELHISPKLLHGGSRIIITTRDEHILKQYGAKTIYEAQLMNGNDAHKLLCRKAFKSDSSSSDFTELVDEVLKHVQHLPLAICEMGSFLFSRNTIQWINILDKFRNYPPNKRMELPHVCYEELGKEISIQNYRFDVFISFRGPDTRRTFVDHLYAHLTRKGIVAFKDDTELQKGASISPQLLQAIRHSRVSIVVFSKGYAASTWCLDEMAAIAHCHALLKQIVFPVFYDVNPSHVRKQDGVYNNDFLTYNEQFGHDPYMVYVWRISMTYLAELAGWDIKNKPEFEEIEKITQTVIKKLGHKYSGIADDLIGLQPRLEELESLLKLSSDDDGSPILGIWGMAGIGKKTLATVLYDRISYQFDACCFIESVSKIYEDGGAIAVQKLILRRTIKENNLDTYSPPEISGIVRNRLHKIKLLVVLDDVDQFEQLQELHISPKSLHAGSRIIITTRDESILKRAEAIIYEAQLMNYDDAYELLCRRAFKSNNSSSTFAELIPEVLKYAQGLPIAIRLMGSFLCGRNVREWRATLDRLQNNPPDQRILKVLRISFEGLEETEREIFLHVACFFNGEMEDYVWRILDACGLNPTIGIPLIVEKSLITIRNKEIHMHGMLKELGKQIVRGEHPDEPELWTRLWHHDDFHHVMTMTKKAIKAKAIVLDQKEDGSKFNNLKAENLSKLEHLKLLILNHKNFSGTPVYLSNSLRYLLWNGYPFICLPSSFQPFYIVELNMPNSSMEQLWSGDQKLPSLKIMDLSNSQNLKVTPCFKGMRNLERLDLAGCINLWHVHPSIGLLEKLKFLSLQNCRSLVCFEYGSESKLSSLRVMRLSGCTQLENTPDLTGALNLEYLDMDQCTCLSKIHKSIGGLAMLNLLTMRDCTNLVELPLVCTFSTPLPSLIILDLSFCNISEIPEAIGELRCLERLNLQGNNFSSVPSTIERLYSLAYLNLSHCHRLENAPELPTHSSPPVGKYFETTSGSRDHRSGLYIFNCPQINMVIDKKKKRKMVNDMESPIVLSYSNVLSLQTKQWSKRKKEDTMFTSFEFKCLEFTDKAMVNCMKSGSIHNDMDEKDTMFTYFAFKWLKRLLEQEPSHFRCGFDIVLPWKWKTVPSLFSDVFNGGSIIRIKPSMNVESIGFVFCVAFEVNSNHPTISGSSLPYPPFYLSFESEYTEEQFNMPLSLERDIVDGTNYLWTIYISPDHCHFVKTGAQITFKAHQCLTVNQWGLCMLTEKHLYGFGITPETYPSLLVIDHVEKSNSKNAGAKNPDMILPYNWFVSDEDEKKNEGAKNKETNLSNLGLLQPPAD